jgi:hypothetical protein
MKDKIMSFAGKWMELENNMLSEIPPFPSYAESGF